MEKDNSGAIWLKGRRRRESVHVSERSRRRRRGRRGRDKTSSPARSASAFPGRRARVRPAGTSVYPPPRACGRDRGRARAGGVSAPSPSFAVPALDFFVAARPLRARVRRADLCRLRLQRIRDIFLARGAGRGPRAARINRDVIMQMQRRDSLAGARGRWLGLGAPAD